MKYVTNLRNIAENYDGFIVDIWGVIHDGRELYAGVLNCLQEMQKNKKEIVFLSNAPRRSFVVKEKFEQMNITKNYYKDIITSGETTFKLLSDQKLSADLGHNFYVMGPSRDDKLLDLLKGYNKITYLEKADFVVITGYKHDDSNINSMIPDLEICLKRKLKLICANPDIFVVRQNGERFYCAGSVAKYYKEEMGGEVICIGKPHNHVYEACFSLLKHIDKKRILALGDNLETDIKGANNNGIDSYLVATGILGDKIFAKSKTEPDLEKFSSICDKYQAHPTGVLKAFVW